jgi:3'-phosphoadenosine 5'-phosphosulfate (PAPS) 3'-phosphatase
MNRIDQKFDVAPDDFHRYNFAMTQFRELGQNALESIKSGSISVELKADGTPVTNIDREIEERFTDAVSKEYGDEDVVLGEESSNIHSTIPEDRRIWRLDPFDGTGWLTRLIEAGDTDYSTLRALLLTAHFKPNETTPAFGVIHSPFYAGITSTISTINGRTYYSADNQAARQISVNSNAPRNTREVMQYEKNGIAGATQDVSEDAMKEIMPLANRIKLPLFMGNITLSNVDLSIYPGPTQPHDVAAGALAVVNAGGTVKDFDGRDFKQIDWRKYPINGVVAGSNESLVDQVVARYTK